MKSSALMENWYERNRTVLFSVSLIGICVAYSSLYFSNTYPITEGWNVFDAELLLRGKVVYRDFYYHMPPLNILIDAVLWRLSFGKLLVYRGWYLLQRIVVILLIFCVMKQEFGAERAFLAAAVTAVVFTGAVHDLFGDYNQTTILLSVIFLHFALCFSRQEDINSRHRALLCAGLILGLMFLCKQTIFVATLLCYVPTLALFCLRTRDKRFAVYCAYTALGSVPLVAAAILYLVSQNAFFPFVEEVFLHTDGKGALLDIILINVLRCYKGAIIPALLLFSIGLLMAAANTDAVGWFKEQFEKLYIRLKHASALVRTTVNSLLFSLGLFALVLFGFQAFNWYTMNLRAGVIEDNRILLAFLPSVVLLVVVWLFWGQRVENPMVLLFVCLSIFLPSVFFAASSELSSVLYTFTNLYFCLQTELPTLLSVLCLLSAIYFVIRRKYTELFLCCGAFTLSYAFAMTAALTSPAFYSLALALPLFLCFATSFSTPDHKGKQITFSLLCLFCAVACSVCVAQKRIAPYTWWGSSPAAYEKRSVPVTGVPALAGVSCTEDEAEAFQEISRLIEENTAQNEEVWGYPYIKLFNILTNRYHMDDFVPVLFYDIVGDRYVEQETELLKKKLPELVLWKNIFGCKEAHEIVYRNGKRLKQRTLEELFDTWITQRYKVIGYYNGIEVYRLREKGKNITTGNLDDIISVEEFEEKQRPHTYRNGVRVLRFTVNNPLSFRIPAVLKFRGVPDNCDASCAIWQTDGISHFDPVAVVNSNKRLSASCEVPSGRSMFYIFIIPRSRAHTYTDNNTEMAFERVIYS